MFKRLKNKKGFTLIELLVVISIIGLLSSVVLASLTSLRARGRDTLRAQSLIQIRNALSLYALANNGTYPSDAHTQTGDWPNAFKTALAQYMPDIPVDPVLNQGDPGWQFFGMTSCDTSTNYLGVAGNNSCYWLNSPQAGSVCAGKKILYAYRTEGKVKLQHCPTTDPRVMTVVVSE